MYNGAFSPIIQTPLSASGVDNLFVRQNSPMIFAGGTHIMREVMNYPNVTVPEIVDIRGIMGMDKFVQTEKSIEIGAINTIARVRELGESYFNDVIKACLAGGAPECVKRKATIGGALVADGVYYNLVAPLVHLGAMVEVHYYTEGETLVRVVPLSSIYDTRRPKLQYRTFITRVIIPQDKKNDNQFYYYRALGSPVCNPGESMVFVGSLSNDSLTSVNIEATILFSDIGFYTLGDKNQMFRVASITSFQEIQHLGEAFGKSISERFALCKTVPSAERIQKAVRIFEDFLLAVTERFL